jgi:hypothetical protein
MDALAQIFAARFALISPQMEAAFERSGSLLLRKHRCLIPAQFHYFPAGLA